MFTCKWHLCEWIVNLLKFYMCIYISCVILKFDLLLWNVKGYVSWNEWHKLNMRFTWVIMIIKILFGRGWNSGRTPPFIFGWIHHQQCGSCGIYGSSLHFGATGVWGYKKTEQKETQEKEIVQTPAGARLQSTRFVDWILKIEIFIIWKRAHPCAFSIPIMNSLTRG